MARIVIQNATTGEIRQVDDVALSFFPGYVQVDTIDDEFPPTLFYTGADADARYVNVAEISDPDSPASVALRAAFALDAGADPTDAKVAAFLTPGTTTRGLLNGIIRAGKPVNVLDYDAKGDGVTDDTAAVVAALAALPTRGSGNLKTSTTYAPGTEAWQGGVLYFPAGVYLVTGIDLSGKSNIVICGDGPATVIKNTATGGAHAIKAINAAGSTKNRLQVRDLMVMGNAASGDGIHFENVDYPLVFNVHAQENGRDGVNIFATESGGPASGLEDRIVSHLWAQWNGRDGLHLEGGHEILNSSLHLEENIRHGFYADNVTNLHVAVSSIEDNGDQYEMYLTQARQVDVVDVAIEGDVYWAPRVSQIYYARFTNVSWTSFTASVLSGVSQYLMLNACTGTLTGVGHTGSTGYLRLAATGSNLTISELSGRDIDIVGGTTVLGAKAGAVEGLIQVSGGFTLSGRFTLAGTPGLKVQALAASATFTVSACRGTGAAGVPLTFSGNGQSGVRCAITGLHATTLDMVIDAVAIVSLVGGIYAGVASLTVSGAGSRTKLSELLLYATMAVTIAASRTGLVYVRGCDKDGTATFTDNTAAVVKTDSTV